MTFTTICWLATILYSILMIYIGVRIARQNTQRAEGNTPYEFWIAKRTLPGWWLGTSITAGWLMLGWVSFGMSQVYQLGATGLWVLFIPWFILCFLIILMVPFLRRISAVSVPQAIQQRYGPAARMLVAVFSFFVFLSWTQAELFMAGTLMSPFLGVEPWVCMVVFILPVIVYTYLGGFRAVVTTDVIQFCIMAVFMLILGGFALTSASEVSGGNILAALQNVKPPLVAAGQTLNLWVYGVSFPFVLLLGYLPGWLIEQDLTLRLQAAPTTKEANRGAWLALVLISVFVLLIPAVVAFCALIVFPPIADQPPAALNGDATTIISAFITGQMPPWLQVFMLVGILGCQMSTVDTFGNVTAMALSYDVVEQAAKRHNVTEAGRGRLAQWISVVALLMALGCALISNRLGDVYYLSSGVLSASIALPVLFIFWKRTTPHAVIAGAIMGFLGTLGMYLYEYKFLQAADQAAAHYYTEGLPTWLQNSYGYNYVAAGVVLSAVTIAAVSLLTPQPSKDQVGAVKPVPVDDAEVFRANVY